MFGSFFSQRGQSLFDSWGICSKAARLGNIGQYKSPVLSFYVSRAASAFISPLVTTSLSSVITLQVPFLSIHLAPILTLRSLLRRGNPWSSNHPSVLRLVPPSQIRQRQTQKAPMVHSRPSLARPHRHHLRSRKLRLRSPCRGPSSQMGYRLVDRFRCPCRNVFRRICHLGINPETSTTETKSRSVYSAEHTWNLWTSWIWWTKR